MWSSSLRKTSKYLCSDISLPPLEIVCKNFSHCDIRSRLSRLREVKNPRPDDAALCGTLLKILR
jgi:hypothetical protein